MKPSASTEPFLSGLTFQKIPGDNDCLFRAIGYCILGSMPDDDYVKNLRDKVADDMEAHADENIDSLGITHEAFRERIRLIRETHEWGGDLELGVLARILDRPVVVIYPNQPPLLPDNHVFAGNPVFLFYNGRDHYDAFSVDEGADSKAILQLLAQHLAKGKEMVYSAYAQTTRQSVNFFPNGASFANDCSRYNDSPSTASLDDLAYLEYKKKQRERLDAIDYTKLTKLIEEANLQAEKAKDYNLVLLVGRSDAGKTALLNYLKNSEMELYTRGLKQHIRVKDGQTEYGVIGQTFDAETLWPQIVPLSVESKLAYADCPGYGDNREIEKRLCSSVGVPMALNYANGIQVMLTVVDVNDLTVSNADNVVSLLKTLNGLLENLDELGSKKKDQSSQWLFAFTKVKPEATLDDILTTVKDLKESLTARLERQKESLEQLLYKLASALGLSKEWRKTKGSCQSYAEITLLQEQRMDLIRRIELLANEERASLAVKKLYAQFKQLGSEIIECTGCVGILIAILDKADNDVFIIRGDERDDKNKLQTRIQEIADYPPIPKEHFILDGGVGPEWTMLDEVLQDIVLEGTGLLDAYRRYPDQIRAFKNYKHLLQQQKSEWEQIQLELSRKEISATQVNEINESLVSDDRQLLTYLAQTTKEKEAEKKLLEAELQALDVDNPKRYEHQSLKPIQFKEQSCVKRAGLRFGLNMLSWAPLVLVGEGIIIPTIFLSVLKSLKAITSSPKAELTEKCRLEGGRGGSDGQDVVGNGIDYLLVRALRSSYQFEYTDLPFILVEPHSDASEQGLDIYDKEKTFVEKARKLVGFDISSEEKNEAAGQYKITYYDYAGTTAWIELFVKTKQHPEIAARIQLVKKSLMQIKTLMHGQFKADQIYLEDRMRAEAKLDKMDKAQLLSILKERIINQQERIQQLFECLLGFRAEFVAAESALLSPYFKLVKFLLPVLNSSSELMKNFPIQYQNVHAEILNSQKDHILTRSAATVWGRKATPQEQPDYIVMGAKIKGSAMGARYGLSDKPYALWFGKLGYNSLPGPAAVGLSAQSRVRRGTILETLLEKLASDLYCHLSLGTYLVPKTRLAELPVMNQFTEHHPLAHGLLHEINLERAEPISKGVYVMSKYISGYQDLSELACLDNEGQEKSFEACLNQLILPEVAFIEGKQLPIKGLMEALAIARLLADTDVLGSSGRNAGYLVERNPEGEAIAIRVVKIDPGYAFNFTGPQNQCKEIQTRDLQFSNMGSLICWDELSEDQQRDFVSALYQGLDLLQDKEQNLLDKLMGREALSKTPDGIDLPSVSFYLTELETHLEQQRIIYQNVMINSFTL